MRASSFIIKSVTWLPNRPMKNECDRKEECLCVKNWKVRATTDDVNRLISEAITNPVFRSLLRVPTSLAKTRQRSCCRKDLKIIGGVLENWRSLNVKMCWWLENDETSDGFLVIVRAWNLKVPQPQQRVVSCVNDVSRESSARWRKRIIDAVSISYKMTRNVHLRRFSMLH